MIFDIAFAEEPLAAVDAAGGAASIVIRAAEAQQEVLRKSRRGMLRGQRALYLDGWSTWVEHRGRPSESSELHLNVLFAPRAIAAGDARGFTALIDATDGEDGAAIGFTRTGHIAAVVTGELRVGDLRLKRDRWHHLALSVAGGQIELSLDGVLAGAFTHSLQTISVPALIFVGRSRDDAPAARLFLGAAANGTLARAVADVLPINVETSGTDLGVHESVDNAPDRSRYWADPHRPIAHVTAAQGWMNEPHAAIELDGTHHLFSQHNPVGPYWGGIAWAHVTSADLARWRDEPVALAPSDTTVAPDGIWSGSSVQGPAGEHFLYFTAGDMSRAPDQSVAIAHQDGPTWTADEQSVLKMPDSAPGRTERLVEGQFRDPFVWREDSRWFMTVGAGLSGTGGTALLFTSEDGRHWEQKPPLLVGDVSRFPATGVMWELPVLLPLGNGVDGRRRHALFVAPWWAGASEYHLQHVWHWVGVWDAVAGTFAPDHVEPREFDGGGHLTGPSGNVLSDGRAVLWTIAQDKRSLEELAESGWAHNAGWPLQLGLHDDGSLSVKPVDELQRLRRERLEPGPPDRLARGRHLDIELEVHGGTFEVEVLRSGNGSEGTVLGVDRDEVWVDRSRSSLDENHTEGRRRIARPGADVTRARIVVDGSMIEMYVDDRVSLTSRAYPRSPDATGVQLRLGAEAKITHLVIHTLDSAFTPVDPTNDDPSRIP